MPFDLDTVQKLINSPPGQLVAGATLGGIVWKFFKNVGDVLREETNREVAAWLLARPRPLIHVWPQIFLKVLPATFGGKRPKIAHYWGLCLVVSSVAAVNLASSGMPPSNLGHIVGVALFLYLAVPMSMSGAFGFSGFVIQLQDETSLKKPLVFAGLTSLTDVFSGSIFATIVTAWWVYPTFDWVNHPILTYRAVLPFLPRVPLLFLPFMVRTLSLVLYGVAGFIIQSADAANTGFQWFNRHFDIEKKPLQSIGLVAGALVAVVYWAAVIVSKAVHHGA